MSAIVFNDIFKTVNDYFSKPYVGSSLVVEAKLTAAECDNLKITPLVEKSPQNTVLSGIEFEQATPFRTTAFTNSKVNIKSNGAVKGELKVSKFGIDGLGVNFGGNVNLSESGKDSHDATIEFKKPSGTLVAKFATSPKGIPLSELSFTVLYNNRFLVGALAQLSGQSITAYQGGVSVVSPDSTLVVQATSENSIKIGGLYNTATRCQIGGELELSNDKDPSARLGVQRTINGTKFNAKVGSSGIVSLAASHKLGRVTSTVSTEIDAKKCAVVKTGLKFMWEE